MTSFETAVAVLGALLVGGALLSGLARRSFLSLTAAFVFLYSVYLYASALLFGGEVAAAWSVPPDPNAAPWRVQLRRAVRGLYRSTEETR